MILLILSFINFSIASTEPTKRVCKAVLIECPKKTKEQGGWGCMKIICEEKDKKDSK